MHILLSLCLLLDSILTDYSCRKLEESAKIGSYMKDLMVKYEELRGARPGPGQFWDAVVISAGDAAQQTWYEAQLEMKRGAGELPIVPFLIIPDPPGPRSALIGH